MCSPEPHAHSFTEGLTCIEIEGLAAFQEFKNLLFHSIERTCAH